MSVKLLTEHHLEFLSLKGGCTGSSESTLVKLPDCWKSHVGAYILFIKYYQIVGSYNFSAQFIKIISHYKKICYNINVLQQTACLVVNPITVGNFAFLFNCTLVGRTSDSFMVPT